MGIGTRIRVLGVLLGIALLAGCASTGSHGDTALNRYEFTEPQMGMPFRIVLYAPDASSAQAAAAAAFQRVSELNDVLSDYDTDSELSRLSQTAGSGRAVPVSDTIWSLLTRAQALAVRTEGAFDITAGPVISHWRKARRTRTMPSAESLAEAAKASGYSKLRLDPRGQTAELTVPYMRLDLGAIAKGYALDQALAVLRQRGFARALASCGGDMAAGAPPPGRRGWRVEVAPLDVTNAPPSEYVLLHNRGLATSGDLFQHVEINGNRYSHIVDPRTGLGLTDHSLVAVIAPDATTADSLSTAVSVLGPAAGVRLVDATPGAAVHIVRQPGARLEKTESRGWAKYIAR